MPTSSWPRFERVLVTGLPPAAAWMSANVGFRGAGVLPAFLAGGLYGIPVLQALFALVASFDVAIELKHRGHEHSPTAALRFPAKAAFANRPVVGFEPST